MKANEEFRVFFERQIGPLRALAYRLTGSWTEAEDLAQDAMVRTLRAWKRAEQPELYARAALINRHRSLLRRVVVQRRALSFASEVAEHGFDPEAAAMWEEVLRLPARQREALVLHYYEGLTQVEVARVMNVAEGTVNSLVYRGLERLRARFAPNGEPVGSES